MTIMKNPTKLILTALLSLAIEGCIFVFGFGWTMKLANNPSDWMGIAAVGAGCVTIGLLSLFGFIGYTRTMHEIGKFSQKGATNEESNDGSHGPHVSS